MPSSRGSARVSARADLAPARTYRLAQSYYFEPGFDWGGRNEGGKMGFGFGGGSAPSGGQLQPDGFTSRFMWRGNKDGTAHAAVYAYSADRSQNLPYGDDHRLEDFQIPVGRWFTLVMEVELNSSTGSSDGSLRAWADGRLALERRNMAWQTRGSTPRVEDLFFSTFYGGADPSWSPDGTTHIRFADVCWAPVIDGASGIDPEATDLRTPYDDPRLFADDVNGGGPLTELQDDLYTRLDDVHFEVELLVPTEIEDIDRRLHEALDRLVEAREPRDWIDGDRPSFDTRAGARIEEAARALRSLSVDPSAPDWVRGDVDASLRELSEIVTEIAAGSIVRTDRALEASGCTATTEPSATCLFAAGRRDRAVGEMAALESSEPMSAERFELAVTVLEVTREALGALREQPN